MSSRVVIEPGSSSRHYWRDVWQYRGLLFFLSWRDVMVRYKQTAIGIMWSVLRPLITIGVVWFIGWLFESSVPDNVPRVLLVCAATLPWTFFSFAFSDTANSLIANSNLLTKVYFPRIIIPISTVFVCLIDFFISFLILIGIMIYYQYAPGIEILLLPLFLLLALLTAFGAGLWIASLNVKYRDFRVLVPFIVQFGLYVTPVIFQSSQIYESTKIPVVFKYLYSCNPVVGVIDGFRYCILGNAQPIFWPGFLISVAISFILLFIGIWYFRKTEKSFADII